jgi:hypothetical protein
MSSMQYRQRLMHQQQSAQQRQQQRVLQAYVDDTHGD